MATEEQALDFILSLKTPGWDMTTRKITRGLDDIATAAENAHAEVMQDKKSIVERLLPGDLTKMAPAKLKLISMGAKGLGAAIAGVKSVVDSGIESWKANYLELVKWRREVGLDKDQVNDFSNLILSSTAKFGFQLDKVTSIVRFMHQGSRNAKKELVDLGAAMGQFERVSGVSTETTGNLARALVQQRKALDPKEFENTMMAVRETMRGVSGSADEMLSILEKNSEIFQTYGKDRVKPLIKDITAFSAAVLQSGGNMEDAEAIVGQLADRQSFLSRMYVQSGFDLASVFDLTKKLAGESEEDFRSRQKMAESFGISTKQLNILMEAASKTTESRIAFESVLGRTVEQNRQIEIDRATGIEKIKFLWQDMENAIAHTTGTIVSDLTPAFEAVLIVAGDLIKITTAWVHDFADGIKGLKTSLVGLVDMLSSPIESVKSILSDAGMKVGAITAAGQVTKLMGAGDVGSSIIQEAMTGKAPTAENFLGKQASTFNSTPVLGGLNRWLGDMMAPMFTNPSVPMKPAPMPVPAALNGIPDKMTSQDAVVKELRGLRQDLEKGRTEDRHHRLSDKAPANSRGENKPQLSLTKVGIGG